MGDYASSDLSLSVEQPEQHAENRADEDAGDQRKIKCRAVALVHDVARQPAKPDARQAGPHDPDRQEHRSQADQEPLHIHPPFLYRVYSSTHVSTGPRWPSRRFAAASRDPQPPKQKSQNGATGKSSIGYPWLI